MKSEGGFEDKLMNRLIDNCDFRVHFVIEKEKHWSYIDTFANLTFAE